ncbi:MAG: DUF5107 domain-containing protein [Clostridiaceae bacterium]
METTVKHETFLGAEAIVLENDCLRCVCLPKHGGKIASFYRKDKAFELLFQNPHGVFQKAYPGAPFGDFEACGFDDAFPNIDAETVRAARGKAEYFDHGEIWTASFAAAVEDGSVCLTYSSPFLGYRYEKRLTLEADTLQIGYRIANGSGQAFPCIWACHCLVNLLPGLRLLFPRGTERVINVFDSPLLGDAGRIYRFPVDRAADGAEFDFSRTPDERRVSMMKIYCADAVQEGFCGYRYEAQGVEAVFRYDAKRLPYLGFWVTAGGYRGDFNCALEPTNGFYDSIHTAAENGKCAVLQPREGLEFSLEISLSSFDSLAAGMQ